MHILRNFTNINALFPFGMNGFQHGRPSILLGERRETEANVEALVGQLLN
jgi:hypothetical protein